MTKEHVYPLWLTEALNIRGGVTFSTHDTPIRSAATLDVKVREVCRGCNNGWLHDLEAAFRSVMVAPMNGFGLIGMPTPVQLVMSLWAIKTWLLIERSLSYLRGETPMYAGPEVFRWLRENREPPPAMQVFIGAVDRDTPGFKLCRYRSGSIDSGSGEHGHSSLSQNESRLGGRLSCASQRAFKLASLPVARYFDFVPNKVVTGVNGPVIVIRYVAVGSDSDFVARL